MKRPKVTGDFNDPLDPSHGDKNFRENQKKQKEESKKED